MTLWRRKVGMEASCACDVLQAFHHSALRVLIGMFKLGVGTFEKGSARAGTRSPDVLLNVPLKVPLKAPCEGAPQ